MSSLVARISIYLVSGLVGQGAALLLWLLLPWFLSPAEVGYVSLALFAIESLSMLSMAGMDAAVIRFAAHSETRDSTLTAALTVAGVSFVIVSLLTGLASKTGIPFLATTMTWVSAHYVLVLVAVAANILWSLYQSYQVAARQSREYATFQIIRAVVYLVLGIGLAFLYREASVVPAAAAAATLTVLALFMRSKGLPVQAGNPFRIACIGPMVGYGLPLTLNSVLGVGTNYTQRLVVDHYSDIATLGIFGFFAAIAIQVNGFWASFNRAWTPEYFSLVEVDPARAMRLLQGIMVLVCMAYPLMLAFYVVIGELFLNGLVFKYSYSTNAEILYLLLLAPLFCGIYIVAYPIYYYELKTQRIVYISVFVAVGNLLISIVLIQRWGMVGAASSFVIQAVVSAGTYLLSYRGWAKGATRVAFLLTAVTALAIGAAAALIMTHSAWLFVAVLLAIAVVAWGIGGSLASPLLSRFLKIPARFSAVGT